jgi:hypothetical protein
VFGEVRALANGALHEASVPQPGTF